MIDESGSELVRSPEPIAESRFGAARAHLWLADPASWAGRVRRLIADPRSWVGRLRDLIAGPGPSAALRRKVAGLGLAGALLALSGSQAVVPVAVAFVKVDPEPVEGESYFYDALWSGVPDATTADVPVIVPANAPVSAAKPFGLSSPAPLTASGIPQPAYRAYVAAAAELATTDPECAISWTLIAGIGRVESNHGRYGGSTITASGLVTPAILGIRLDGSRPGTARISDSDNGRYDGDTAFDRAVGPMQFLPGTWESYGAGADPQNMNAAALATGKYLCAGSGSLATQQGRWAAVYRYNHSDSYVSLVLSLADSYATGKIVLFPARPAGTPAPDDNAPSASPPGTPPSVPAPDPTPSPTGEPTTKPSPTGSHPPLVRPTKPTGPTTAPPTTTKPADPTSQPPSDPTSNPPTSDPTTDPPTSDPTTEPPAETTTAPATTEAAAADPTTAAGSTTDAATAAATTGAAATATDSTHATSTNS